MSERQDRGGQEPFRRALEPSELGNERLFASPDQPDALVRASTLSFEDLDHLHGPELTSYLAKARDEFKTLRDTYGVAVPEFQYFIGQNEHDEPTLYTRAERIEGTSMSAILEDETLHPRPTAAEIDEAMAGAMSYVKDRVGEGEDMLSDISLSQFVYGKTTNDEKPRLYMVDLDPIIRTDHIGGVYTDILLLLDGTDCYAKLVDEYGGEYPRLLEVLTDFNGFMEYPLSSDSATRDIIARNLQA